MINVAINGFGRIGRRVFRLIQDNPKIQVVAINDLADAKTLGHLLKYDSIHGIFKGDVTSDSKNIIVNGRKIPLINKNHPKKINWKPYNIDFVIESTGRFKTKEMLQHHINNGAKRVILSVPPLEDDIKTVVLGVKDDILDKTETIVSNASCTTNNAAPMLDVVNKLCIVKEAYITTVHSYTTD